MYLYIMLFYHFLPLRFKYVTFTKCFSENGYVMNIKDVKLTSMGLTIIGKKIIIFIYYYILIYYYYYNYYFYTKRLNN